MACEADVVAGPSIPPDVLADLYDRDAWADRARLAAWRAHFARHLAEAPDPTAAAWRAIVSTRRQFGDWTPRATRPGLAHVSEPLTAIIRRVDDRQSRLL